MLGKFPKKSTQRRRFGCRRFVGKCSGDHYLWGRQRFRIRERERLVSNVDPMEAWHPTVSCGAEWSFIGILHWGKRVGLGTHCTPELVILGRGRGSWGSQFSAAEWNCWRKVQLWAVGNEWLVLKRNMSGLLWHPVQTLIYICFYSFYQVFNRR